MRVYVNKKTQKHMKISTNSTVLTSNCVKTKKQEAVVVDQAGLDV